MSRGFAVVLLSALIAFPALAGSFSDLLAKSRAIGAPEPSALAILAIGLTTALRKRIR